MRSTSSNTSAPSVIAHGVAAEFAKPAGYRLRVWGVFFQRRGFFRPTRLVALLCIRR